MTDELSQATPDASNAQAASTADEPVSLEANIDAAFDAVDAKIGDDEAAAAKAETPAVDPENPTPEAAANPDPEAEAAAAEAAKAAEAAEQALAAPDRFTSAAKTEWANTPPAVQAEVDRMRTELESGLSQKDEQLKKYEGLEEFVSLAESQGQTVADMAKNYAGMENMLRKDPIAGFQQIAQNLGLNFQQVAAHVLNVQPNQQAMQYEQTINGLRNELSGLKLQFQNIDNSMTEQNNAALQGEIEAFAKDHEHFETVRADMGGLISSEMAKDLPEAYELAVKMRGLTATPKKITKDEDLAAQTQKGKLSVDGAPASGSNPDKAKPPKSAREAVDRAFATIG